MFGLMAIQPGRQHGIDVGALLRKALGWYELSHDFAWRECGWRDGAQFSRAINGEQHAPLDLWKVMELPTPVLELFLTELLGSVMQRGALKMAKADLVTRSDRKAG